MCAKRRSTLIESLEKRQLLSAALPLMHADATRAVGTTAASITTLSGSPVSVVAGATVTFNVTVTPASTGTVTPSGTVSFIEDGTTLGSSTLQADGTAAFSAVGLPNGNDSVIAIYSGDSIYSPSTSSVFVEKVGLTAPSVALASSSDTVVVGNQVLLTAIVAPPVAGGQTPTGGVHFIENGSIDLGNANLVNGSATLSVFNLALGTDTVIAAYSGDDNYAALNSTAVAEQVTALPAATSVTTLASTATVTSPGTFVTFTATVVLSSGVEPLGRVTFSDASTDLKTVDLAPGGIAKFTTSGLATGVHSITATYSGSTGFAASKSGPLAIQIVKADLNTPSFTTLTTSTTSIKAGDLVKFTAVVSPTLPGGATPTGTVYFNDTQSALGSAVIQSDGTAVFTTTALPPGQNNITACYFGDANSGVSNSTPVSVTVAPVKSLATAALGSVRLPATSVAGGKFSPAIPVVVTNSNTFLSGRFSVELFLSTIPTLDKTAVEISSVQKKMALGYDGSKTLIASAKFLPATMATADYYLLMEVFDPAGATSVSTFPATVHVDAHFVALKSYIGAVTPSAVPVGGTGSVLVSVTNTGNASTSGPLNLTLVLSADGQTALAGQTLAAQIKTVTLKAGETRVYRVRFTVPATTSPGSYYPMVNLSLDGISTSAVGPSLFTVG